MCTLGHEQKITLVRTETDLGTKWNWLWYELKLTWVRTEDQYLRAWLTQTTQNWKSVTPRYNNRSHLNNSWKFLFSYLSFTVIFEGQQIINDAHRIDLVAVYRFAPLGTKWLGYELKLTWVRTQDKLFRAWLNQTTRHFKSVTPGYNNGPHLNIFLILFYPQICHTDINFLRD